MSFKSTILMLGIILFSNCEDAPQDYNPLDPEGPEYQGPPETTLTVEIASGDTITTDSINMSWVGNELTSEYSYMLDYNGWSDWSPATSVMLPYLDEGEHTFWVKGRYSVEFEDESPAEIVFIVNALQGPGLRIYKLLSNVIVNDALSIEIFTEDVNDLTLAEFQVEYDNNLIQLEPDAGDALTNFEFIFIDVEDTIGLLQINFSTLNPLDSTNSEGSPGLSGSKPVVLLHITGLSEGTTEIRLKNVIFRDSNNNNIPVSGVLNGVVVIQ